jgi:hypothetical protein
MPLQNADRQIDGHKYTVRTFPTRVSLEILARLTRLFGPSLAEFDEDGFGAAAAAKTLVGSMDKVDVCQLVLDMAETHHNVLVDGEKMQGENIFDLHFAGRLGALIALVTFVMECNYRDFFDLMRAAVATVKNATKKAAAETGQP